MKKVNISLSRDSVKKVEYLLQNTQADSFNTLIKLSLDVSYNIARKNGRLD